MKMSLRNQITGTVRSVTTGEAMAVVKVEIEGGHVLTSSITRESAEDLGLEAGKRVSLWVKSTDVALGVED
ncbi:MAG: TOBE domain-containing protein [Bowdeniella nasicola]|nr:TOBE domain-containing protein [Bowdeniella nasicola]